MDYVIKIIIIKNLIKIFSTTESTYYLQIIKLSNSTRKLDA